MILEELIKRHDLMGNSVSFKKESHKYWCFFCCRIPSFHVTFHLPQSCVILLFLFSLQKVINYFLLASNINEYLIKNIQLSNKLTRYGLIVCVQQAYTVHQNTTFVASLGCRIFTRFLENPCSQDYLPTRALGTIQWRCRNPMKFLRIQVSSVQKDIHRTFEGL